MRGDDKNRGLSPIFSLAFTKSISARTKVMVLGLLVLGMANLNNLTDFLAGDDHALIREMRLVARQNPHKYQEDQDAVVSKHIPLGTSAEAAMETCQKNGFETGQHKTLMMGEIFPGFDEVVGCTRKETRWSLIFSDEYLVFAYIKNGQVGAVAGRAFLRLFGSI